MRAPRASVPARFLLALIRLYQMTFSAILGKECRFHPSCSHYTAQSIEKHGAWRGGRLGVMRIVRCHPWNPGGYDPVPETLPAGGKFFSKNQCNCDKDAGNPRTETSCTQTEDLKKEYR
jgi:uncharacterized protein